MNEILHMPIDGCYSAILVTEIPHKHHLMFKATLESGYSNIFYNDVETGLCVKKITKTSEGTQVTTMGNYKEVKGAPGLKMPYTVSINNGQGEQKVDFSSVEANTGLKPTAFK